MKTQKIETNKKGQRVALVFENDYNNLFSVYLERENYSRGRMVKTWVYIKRGMTIEEATKLFNRKVA